VVTLLAILLLGSTLGAGLLLAESGYSLSWDALTGGGGASSGGAYQVQDSLGQPIAALPATGGNFELQDGFWGREATATPTNAPTSTPTATSTPVTPDAPTHTPTATPSRTHTPTNTPTSTHTPTTTPTHPTITPSHTPTPTATATATPPVATDHTVDVANNSFSPQVLTIKVGEKVTWRRQNGFHSVTADDGSFNQPASSSWTTFSRTFPQAGSFPYHCSAHGGPAGTGMSGTVIVEPATGTQENPIYLPVVVR